VEGRHFSDIGSMSDEELKESDRQSDSRVSMEVSYTGAGSCTGRSTLLSADLVNRLRENRPECGNPESRAHDVPRLQ